MRLLVFTTLLISAWVCALPSDVPANHWAAQAVLGVTTKGWLQGYPGGTFRGEVLLDRYQLATTLARVLADSPLPVREAEVRFRDVKASHWALPGIRRMVGEGLVQGFPDQTYRGSSVLTRYQLAVVLDKLAQSLGVPKNVELIRPDDLPQGHWAEAAVMRVVAHTIMPLGSDGQFRGNQPVNRYQMALSLWRLNQYLAGEVAGRPAETPSSGGADAVAGPSQTLVSVPAGQQPAVVPVVQATNLQPVADSEKLLLGNISAVPLPAAWASLSFAESLVHLGQSQRSDQVWATFRKEGESAVALLKIGEKPVIEAFYTLSEAAAVASEGWIWLEGGQKLMFVDPKNQKTRLYGPIGLSGAREALPPVFASGIQQGLLGGVALDESRNYLALINGRPLCSPSCDATTSSSVLRLVLLGLNPDGLFAEYAYLLDDARNRVVGLAWPKPRLLLIHEHGGQKSRIYSVDFNQADDLAFTEWDSPEAGLELKPQVKPLSKKLVLEVALDNPRGLALLGPAEAVTIQQGLLRLSLNKPLW